MAKNITMAGWVKRVNNVVAPLLFKNGYSVSTTSQSFLTLGQYEQTISVYVHYRDSDDICRGIIFDTQFESFITDKENRENFKKLVEFVKSKCED